MYLKIKVRAKSKKELVEELSFDTYGVSVREPAERNLANKRVRELIAARFGLSVGQVKIISGHQSPHKILSLPD